MLPRMRNGQIFTRIFLLPKAVVEGLEPVVYVLNVRNSIPGP